MCPPDSIQLSEQNNNEPSHGKELGGTHTHTPLCVSVEVCVSVAPQADTQKVPESFHAAETWSSSAPRPAHTQTHTNMQTGWSFFFFVVWLFLILVSSPLSLPQCPSVSPFLFSVSSSPSLTSSLLSSSPPVFPVYLAPVFCKPPPLFIFVFPHRSSHSSSDLIVIFLLRAFLDAHWIPPKSEPEKVLNQMFVN